MKCDNASKPTEHKICNNNDCPTGIYLYYYYNNIY